MRLGLHALVIGTGARREVIEAVAVAAEAAAFSTHSMGRGARSDGRSQHVALPLRARRPARRAADADWLDPMIALSFSAATTRRIRLATGVLLVPEHNPVTLAQ